MSLEQYKTQVLLLHSQQSTLDTLSAGFNDQYSVHCATSGTEALQTLGDTPIHVIVSAQDLPGMSGLDALREAKKRSPDTIGILLAGTDKEDGLEALVGDQEVFQIVRGAIAPEALIELIESANKRVRLVALSESANDQRANVDEPVAEHIVMETSENGATIISDGTGRFPSLKPGKVDLAPGVGGREVDVLVLTKDEEFLGTIRDSARGLHNVYHALTPAQAEEIVAKNHVGVLVTDAAMVGSNVEALSQRLRINSPRVVAIVAGRRDDGELLMDLINRGHVYRFLLKPVSPGRARLAIEASVKHHMEAPDDAFKPKKPLAARDPKPTAMRTPKPAPKAAPAPAPAPTPKAALKPPPAPVAINKPQAAPVAKPEPAKPKANTPQAKPTPQPVPKAPATPRPVAKTPQAPTPKPAPRPQAKATPEQKIEPTISAQRIEPLLDDELDIAFDETDSFTATVAGIATSIGSSISGIAKADSNSSMHISADSAASPPGLFGPRNLAIGGGAVAALVIVAWLFIGGESDPAIDAPLPVNQQAVTTPNNAPVTLPSNEPALPTPVPSTGSGTTNATPQLLADARIARDNGNLIDPPGNNAVELYLAAAAATDGDAVVRAELDDVVAQVLSIAENAILAKNPDTAESALTMARLADPANSRLPFLDAQINELLLRDLADQARLAIRAGRFDDAGTLIAEARSLAGGNSAEISLLTSELNAARAQQEIGATIVLANARLDSGSLIAPANDNARFYFASALANDPDNQAAQQGMITIASKLVLQARDAIDNGQLDNANTLLDNARSIDPSSNDLNAAATALADAREAIVQAELQAEATRQLELERQASAERQAEADRLARLQEQADAERQAALELQARNERLTAEQQQADDRRQEELQQAAAATLASENRQADQQAAAAAAAEQEVNNAATASPVGVGAAIPAANKPRAASITPQLSAASVARQASTFGLPGVSGNNSADSPAVQNPPAATNQAAKPVPEISAAQSSGSAEPEMIAVSRLTRTNYVGPEYPRAARRRGVTGAVDITFTVSTAGRVEGIEVTRSNPGSTFDEAAMNAVRQWRFEPVIENGEAVEKRSAVRLSFDLQ